MCKRHLCSLDPGSRESRASFLTPPDVFGKGILEIFKSVCCEFLTATTIEMKSMLHFSTSKSSKVVFAFRHLLSAVRKLW